MSDQQIAEAIAMKVMGWRRTFDGWIHPNIGWISFAHWNPTKHITQAFQVQAKIAEHGRPCESMRKFIDALLGMAASDPANIDDPNAEEWTLVNASPRQRCLAALKTIEAANG